MIVVDKSRLDTNKIIIPSIISDTLFVIILEITQLIFQIYTGTMETATNTEAFDNNDINDENTATSQEEWPYREIIAIAGILIF